MGDWQVVLTDSDVGYVLHGKGARTISKHNSNSYAYHLPAIHTKATEKRRARKKGMRQRKYTKKKRDNGIKQTERGQN
eukprot:6213664-Pleurochrysis_carterae.AAC.6